MTTDPTANDEAIGTFIQVALATFGHETWGDAAVNVERAWEGVRTDFDPEWSEIKDRVRAQWPYPVAPE